MTKREWANKQIEMQEVIQVTTGINIVTCGGCGNVMFHELNGNDILCECGFESEPSDFPDLWYNGLENNYSDKPIKDETYLGNIEQGITNLKVYANDYGYKLYFYSNGNLMTECELLDSDHVWRELKARGYKKSIRKVVLSML